MRFDNEKFKQLRKDTGLSQEHFAYTIGVTRGAVRGWETGKAVPSFNSIVKISVTYNVTISELCSD